MGILSKMIIFYPRHTNKDVKAWLEGESIRDTAEVTLTCCNKITAPYIIKILETCSHLKRLTLNFCLELTDVVVETIALKCPELEWLYISESPEITSPVLCEVAMSCPLGSLYESRGLFYGYGTH